MLEKNSPDKELFRLEGVDKYYGATAALRNISFSLPRPCCTVIRGPNGSGKSTLLQILASVIRPTRGKIFFFGQHHPVKQRIGYVSHFPLMYNDLTVEENFIYFSALYGISDPLPLIHEIITVMEITTIRDQIFRCLSRGQQQKASIARSLLHKPDLLILDEPFSGLDPDSGTFIMQFLQNLHESGISIILSQHQPRDIPATAYYTIQLERGTIRDIQLHT